MREQQVSEVARLERALEEAVTAARQNTADREAALQRLRTIEDERARLAEYRHSDRALCQEPTPPQPTPPTPTALAFQQSSVMLSANSHLLLSC